MECKRRAKVMDSYDNKELMFRDGYMINFLYKFHTANPR